MVIRQREDLKREIENSGLVCDCGERVYARGAGPIENRPNYNKYFEYLECAQCHRLFLKEPGSLDGVAQLTRDWFLGHFLPHA